MTISTGSPGHSVPPGQSVTLDASDDPYPFFAYKRNTEPVWRGTITDRSIAPAGLVPDEQWTLFDYNSVFAALRDDEVFSSHRYDAPIGLLLDPTLLTMDAEKHHHFRGLIAEAFRPPALRRWEQEAIPPICEELIDEIKNDGAADLVKGVTFECASRVTSALLGLPRGDMGMLRRLSMDLSSSSVAPAAALGASRELHDYFQQQVKRRRRMLTDDIIGDLVGAEIDGEKLADDAIISFVTLFLSAALQTPYRSLGNLLYLLLRHPEQLRAIEQERSLIGAAIEEGLRYETALTIVPRTTTRAVDLRGRTIPAGATINLCIGSANRDEVRWPESNKFDIHRARQAHIAFGSGIHICLGAHLARAETSALLNSLFDRVTHLQIVDDDNVRIEGLTARSPNKLPVVFRPVS